MSFSEQMSAGRTALASGAYQDAYLAFARAHDEATRSSVTTSPPTAE